MGIGNDFTKIKSNPQLIRRIPAEILRRWARYVINRQMNTKVTRLDTSELNRDHYGWDSVPDGFTWNVFCIQETNLIDFVKANSPDQCQVAVEVGATSDMFLKHVKATTKKGINVLDVCIEQLNSQGIHGIKSKDEVIPIEDNEADLTICFETLEHVHNPIMFLNELSRITKGRLLLSIPWVQNTNIRSKWHGAQSPEGIPESEFHIFEFNGKDFNSILGYTNLKIISYKKLINYAPKYDPITNWCTRRFLYANCFPAIQAYVLEKSS